MQSLIDLHRATYYLFFCGATAASLWRFLQRTRTHTHTHPIGLLGMSDQLVAQAATYKTQKQRKTRTPMSPAGFEPAVPAIEGSHICALIVRQPGIGRSVAKYD